MFRADSVRDATGRLLPAPGVLLNPMRMDKMDKLKTAISATPFEVRPLHWGRE